MRALAALCLCALPVTAQADEDLRLAALIDSLSRADLEGPALRDGLLAAGFEIDYLLLDGPEVLTGGVIDPYFVFLRASVMLKGADPLFAEVTCNRIGRGMLDHLPTAFEAVFNQPPLGARTVQVIETVDFAPGAVAQLWCHVDFMPLSDDVLPAKEPVLHTLQARFDRVTVTEGPALSGQENQGVGWVLYPPLSETSGPEGLAAGQTKLTGINDDPMLPNQASRVVYVHHAGGGVHKMDVVSQLAPQGF